MGPIGDDKFTYLKDVGRLITDFSQADEQPGPPGDTLDDDIGVAVEFEGDEDADEESEVDEVEVCCVFGVAPASGHAMDSATAAALSNSAHLHAIYVMCRCSIT